MKEIKYIQNEDKDVYNLFDNYGLFHWEQLYDVMIKPDNESSDTPIKRYNFVNNAIECESMYLNYKRYIRDYNELYEYEFDTLSEALAHYNGDPLTPILIMDMNDPENPKPIFALYKMIYNLEPEDKEKDFFKRILYNNFMCFKIENNMDNIISIDNKEASEMIDYCSEYPFSYLVENIIDLDLLVNNKNNYSFLYYLDRDDY